MRIPRLALACCLTAGALHSAEVRAGFGVFNAAPRGADLLLDWRAEGSPWSFGFRHVQWQDTSRDPFTHRALSDTLETRTGPLVTYRFRPRARGSWYLAAALYRWTKEERSLLGGDAGRAAATAPAVGGGYTRTLGRGGFFWNAGMLLSPGTRLDTRTSTSSEEDRGTFDLLLQAGFRFGIPGRDRNH
jgi:hypothetical protein